MDKRPTAVVVIGLPTTGKTTLAERLAKRTGYHLIDIDDGPARCTAEQPDPSVSEEFRLRKEAVMRVRYDVLLAAIGANLRENISVIAIATFSRTENQVRLPQVVAEAGGKLKIVRCTYNMTDEEVERRINARVATGAPGGCRSVPHFRGDQKRYKITETPHLVVPMEGGEAGTDLAVQQVLAYIHA